MTDLATGPLELFYHYGQAAAIRGEPLDACPYRRPDRVNAWVRGWHAGDDQRFEIEARRRREEPPGQPKPGTGGDRPAPSRGIASGWKGVTLDSQIKREKQCC